MPTNMIDQAQGRALHLLDDGTDDLAELATPYDYFRLHIPSATLDRLVPESGLQRMRALSMPALRAPDPVMLGLTFSLRAALERAEAPTALFIEALIQSFHAYVVQAYGAAQGARRAALTPWQLKRVLAFIDANLDGDPTIADLAGECHLSPSHFSRAFRESTGLPPYRWLMRRRIERAKELLLEGGTELAEVALICGFVDQSHLNRNFVRFEGCSPGKWRRLRRN